MNLITLGNRIVSRSKNLAGVRRYSGKHSIVAIDLHLLPHGEGYLSIIFDNGAIFSTIFCSFEAMKDFVSKWRNANRAIKREFDSSCAETMPVHILELYANHHARSVASFGGGLFQGYLRSTLRSRMGEKL